MKKTILHATHLSLKAKMVDFEGWHMPVQYPTGIIQEHLATRKTAGLFDISHMGRFAFSGRRAVEFLQYGLTNNCAGLEVGKAQYTMIPNTRGGAVDDAYLYHFREGEFLLVVNASNREKDWKHFQSLLAGFKETDITDRSEELAMLALQGPDSKRILEGIAESGDMPEPFRNSLSVVEIQGQEVWLARTGYTGEPIGFELFVRSGAAGTLWDTLGARGAVPVGLGARDTLRLEAGLPLYGHELGLDPSGTEIPIFSCPLARYAVSFADVKGDYMGKSALLLQRKAYQSILLGNFTDIGALPRRVRSIALHEQGVARGGAIVYSGDRQVGWVTSGTTVPYWKFSGQGLCSSPTEERGVRAACLGLIDSEIRKNERVFIEVRGRRLQAQVVPYHLRSEAPPFARAILYGEKPKEDKAGVRVSAVSAVRGKTLHKVDVLLQRAVDNTRWRQLECINLIPSEQTQSPMTRLLTVMDPAFRYGEHKRVKAFGDMDIFFYQGTGFIEEVEALVEEELRLYLGCRLVEARTISGQMANTVVFSALMDYLNRTDRRRESRKIRSVMNSHIMRGGHLSAQPMGALRDFVSVDPLTEKPSVVNFPVQPGNPYRIDLTRCRELMDRYRPELIILGKSVILHREPVAQIRSFINELSMDTVLMYDMAHVLGLAGPCFQKPFAEGADIVTGSTHKTFFGTQRGVIAADYTEESEKYPLWLTVMRRSFPGSVSNHHLGTLLGLLMSAYEMNHFKDEYQQAVITNAKTLARSLKDLGMDVAGDPDISFTETHQVVLNVGYNRGVEAARELEENNIIVNYQATPQEEGFTASGALRIGVAEMTRFGMGGEEFRKVAQFLHDILVQGRKVKEEVASFRKQFTDLHYCFSSEQFREKIELLHRLI